MHVKSLMAAIALSLTVAGLAVAHAPASAATPLDRAAPERATIPAGDSLVSVPGGGSANLRYDACISDDWAPQNPYAPYDPCGINTAIANGSDVVMRCWTDNQPPTSENPAWTSPRWFFVTLDSGNPERNVSGFIYSALVTDQVRTPNCAGTNYSLYYPFQPSQSSIGIYDESGGVFTINMNNIANGSAGVYCHVGTSGYPTGGTVTYLGQYTVDIYESIKVPFCGTGTQWVGIDASDGIVRYTGEVTIGSSQPPPTPGYLGGIGGQPLTFSATDGYAVGSSITVSGYPAENFGQTNVTVANLALAATSPNGGTDEAVCYSNLTVAPGQIVYCAGTFTPDVAGTWQLNLDWQGGDGAWHHLYEPLDLQIAAVPPPPANDDFANAEDITGLSDFSGTNAGATAEPGEPDHYPGLPARNSAWFKFTAARSGRARVTIDTNTDVTALAAYKGSAVDALTRLATWDATGSEAIAFNVTKGDVYYFAVDDDYGYYPGGAFSGTFAIKPLPPVVTTVLPTLYSKAHYSIQLHAKDGTGPFTWKLAKPSFLRGFTLSGGGVLSGSTAGSGTGTLYVSVTDSENPKVTHVTAVTLRVARDTTAPTGRITKLVPSRGKLSVYWTASDRQSGYGHAQVRVQRIVTHGTQPAWVTTGALPGTSASVRITTTARYRVEIRFVDKSGNVSAWTTPKIVAIRA